MRARWIERWDGPLLDGQRPGVQPRPGEVLVSVEACGVGLTVLNCLRGDLGSDPADLPRIPGHELVGTVTDVGSGVTRELLGQRVMAYFYLCCGRCRRCLDGDESMCQRLAGYIGVHRDGGYAESTVLPQQNVVPLPDDVEPIAATVIPDAIATPVHVAGRAGIRPGQRVAVIAAGGGVGVHMVQVAQVFGAEVVGLEASTEKLEHLERALGVPATDSTNFDDVGLPAGWDDGADVVVDLLGTQPSLEWGLRTLRPDGRLVVLTTFPGRTVSVSPRELVLRQQTVLASRYASRSELMVAADLVRQERVRPVVSECVGPGDVDRLHDALRSGDLLGRGALSWMAPDSAA